MNNTATTTAPTTADDYTQYPEYHASLWVWKICSPILIVFGTVGNILSIMVLTRKKMRVSTFSIYLTVLSVVDILVLYTGLLREWLKIIIEVDIRKLSQMSCKIHIWMVYFTTDLSVWLLVSVTVKRFVSVWFPHKFKQYCTRIMAYIIIGTVGAFLLALNSHYLYGLGDVTKTSESVTSVSRCTSLWDDYDQFRNRVWPWIDLCVFSLVPFTILIIANISIIYRVLASRHNARRVNLIANASTSQQGVVRSRQTSSMTIILLVLNAVFFVCTVPICVYNIAGPYWFVDATPHQDASNSLLRSIVSILMYTNSSINFLMYCTSGSQFRETLKSLFLRNSQLRRRTSMTMRNNISVIGGSDVASNSKQKSKETGNTIEEEDRALNH